MDNPKLRYQQLLSEASFHLLALKLLEYLSRLPKCFSLIGKKRKTWQSTVQYRQLSLLLSYISFFFVLKNQFSTFSISQMRQFCWYFKHCEIIKKTHRDKIQTSMKKIPMRVLTYCEFFELGSDFRWLIDQKQRRFF